MGATARRATRSVGDRRHCPPRSSEMVCKELALPDRESPRTHQKSAGRQSRRLIARLSQTEHCTAWLQCQLSSGYCLGTDASSQTRWSPSSRAILEVTPIATARRTQRERRRDSFSSGLDWRPANWRLGPLTVEPAKNVPRVCAVATAESNETLTTCRSAADGDRTLPLSRPPTALALQVTFEFGNLAARRGRRSKIAPPLLFAVMTRLAIKQPIQKSTGSR